MIDIRTIQQDTKVRVLSKDDSDFDKRLHGAEGTVHCVLLTRGLVRVVFERGVGGCPENAPVLDTGKCEDLELVE